ncbi:MAG: hypothetical protein Q9196_003938 [Gyalolechia fulgens]
MSGIEGELASCALDYVFAVDAGRANIPQTDIRMGEAAEFLRLEALNLREVSVIVYDEERDFTSRLQIPRCTVEQKRQLARMVENTLTFPQEYREVLAAKHRELLELEGLVAAKRYCLDVRYEVQRNELRKALEKEWAESE